MDLALPPQVPRPRTMTPRLKSSRSQSDAGEEDGEDRDQIGLGRPPLPPATMGSGRRKAYSSGGSTGHRSAGGSSAGSGTYRSRGTGSEATSIDYNMNQRADDPLGEAHSCWGGEGRRAWAPPQTA